MDHNISEGVVPAFQKSKAFRHIFLSFSPTCLLLQRDDRIQYDGVGFGRPAIILKERGLGRDIHSMSSGMNYEQK